MTKSEVKKRCSFAAVCVKIFSFLSITVLITILQSCELEPEPPINLIELQILNEDGFPAQRGISVSIGSVRMMMPDINGYCRFENAPIPYDLQVYGGGALYIYNKLNITNPKIVLPISMYSTLHNTCSVPVKCPPVHPGKAALVRFISKELFCESGKYNLIKSADSTIFIQIWLPPDKISITGKLIFIYGEYDPYFEIFISYDKYCIKDVSFDASMNDTVKFTEAEIQFNPPESYVTCTVRYPEYSFGKHTDISIYFPGFNPNSEMVLMRNSHSSGGPWLAQVPGELNIPFEIKVTSSYMFDEFVYYRIDALESFHLLPGASVEIIHNELEVLGPRNLQTGITEDSSLKVREDNERGIYLFDITEFSSNSRLAFVSEKNTVRCGDLKYRNFEIRPGKSYRWIVIKFSAFNSIDDYTLVPYIFQENFHSVRVSDIRYFSTAP